jgi:hypothetical protein
MRKKLWQERVVQYTAKKDAATIRQDLKRHKIRLRPSNSRSRLNDEIAVTER